ncbi:MAG: universal stress protein UspE [Succinatimonas sp.]|nr:universal stress protein UspE [Succinatimonas sp.]
MRQYNRIIAVIEPRRSEQLALKRAIEFAKYNPRVEITALRLVYDFSADIHVLNRMSEEATRQDVLATNKKQLDDLLEPFIKESPVKITPKAVYTRDIAAGILAEAEHDNCDLIIKAANNHKVLDSILFTPIDWYLLRNSKVPVVIAKDHEWKAGGNIVVAVDFSFEGHRGANVALLREAQQLSMITKGKIHLVNSASVVLPTIMLEVPHYAPEVFAQSIVKEHKRRILEFAKAHNIPEENCHIKEGMPDEVIPEICNKLDADAVFVGSAGRSGAMAALIGNTCEEIVDYIAADLIVLNNKTLNSEKD